MFYTTSFCKLYTIFPQQGCTQKFKRNWTNNKTNFKVCFPSCISTLFSTTRSTRYESTIFQIFIFSSYLHAKISILSRIFKIQYSMFARFIVQCKSADFNIFEILIKACDNWSVWYAKFYLNNKKRTLTVYNLLILSEHASPV